MPIILGIITALIQTSFFGSLAPTGWQILISVGLIVYLYRFGLRRVSHATTWWLGLALDLMSSWAFGIWLIIILLVDLLADLSLPKRANNTAESVGLLLVFGLTAVLATGINIVNHQAWFGNALGSAVVTTLIYYLATRTTLAWRIYE